MTLTSKTRFKLCVWNNMFFQGCTIYAMAQGMGDVAMACIAEMGAVTAFYIAGDSFRKSDQTPETER